MITADGYTRIVDTRLVDEADSYIVTHQLRHAQNIYVGGLSATRLLQVELKAEPTIKINGEQWRVVGVTPVDILHAYVLLKLDGAATYLLAMTDIALNSYPTVEFEVDADILCGRYPLVPPVQTQRVQAMSALLPMLQSMEHQFD